jgi:glycosyltransferase involved in cell wall biosynthesis
VRILFVTPYFPPEVGAAQTRIHELAVQLCGLGHDVSILTTFPNYPTGVVPPHWRGKLRWKGMEQGLQIHRVWSYAAPNRKFLRRIIAQMSFAFSGALAIVGMPSFDVVVVESPPLFDGFIGVAAAVRGLSYFFMVSDLWPESAIQMGMLKNRLLIGASRRIEQLFYKKAARILALTEGIRQHIVADGIDEAKVLLFRNSVDCEFFRPGIKSWAMRAKIAPATAKFIALYAGTLGLAQNLGTVLEAAKLCQPKDGIHFVIAGAGAERNRLHQRAKDLHLQNVTFLEAIPKHRMPELINAADCILVPLRALDIFRGALPTKMFEAMACAKPIVLGIEGEAAELVAAANAGDCVPPESAPALLASVQKLNTDARYAAQLGENGRSYVVQHFSRRARALQLNDALESWWRGCAKFLPAEFSKADKEVGAR